MAEQVRYTLQRFILGELTFRQANFLWALNDLPHITVRYFILPQHSPPIPFTRVNHAKYMVTDNAVYIGTSNWSGDYFTDTHGIGVWTTDGLARDTAQAAFDRDWNSANVHPMFPLNITSAL